MAKGPHGDGLCCKKVDKWVGKRGKCEKVDKWVGKRGKCENDDNSVNLVDKQNMRHVCMAENLNCERLADCLVRSRSTVHQSHAQVMWAEANYAFISSSYIHVLDHREYVNDIDIANYVRYDGHVNAVGARIPIRSNWNLRLLDQLCCATSDREVLTFLTFGWPINRDNLPLTCTFENHKSATRYQECIDEYIMTELGHKTLMGPFVTSPFPQEVTGISPLSTRPKRNSSKRRIIMDLSWPIGGFSVNAGIPVDTYLGQAIKLYYPTTDDLCYQAYQLKKSDGTQGHICLEKRHEPGF